MDKLQGGKKMFLIRCQDFLGRGKCNFIARGETKEEVIENTLQHLRKHHPHFLRNLSTGDRLMLRTKLKNISY